MQKTLTILFLCAGLMACSDHDHGPDAGHSHDTGSYDTATAQTVDDHGHEHAADEHDHPHDDHAPHTEAFYGDEAEPVGGDATSTEATTDSEPHSHEEGEHDHQH